MKKFLFLIISAACAFASQAARITYSTAGVLDYSETTESGKIDIKFQKCMINKLFTFYNVSLNGKLVNSAQSSDNIGPFNAGGAWMGGNHNTPQGGSKPSANTIDISITVDGKSLEPGVGTDGKVVVINVKNEIFYTDDKKFADEYVTYRVSGNSIEVWCEHTFLYPSVMAVARYYGPQSMFPATELLLPGTKNTSWINLSGKKEIDVLKSEFPQFSTYVERNTNGYQAVLKYNEGIGNASCISDNGGEVYLFRNYGGATGKSYHVMMWNHNVKNGDVTRWHALYTWFDGPIDDTFRSGAADPEFVYETYINGQSTEITVNADGKSTEPTTGIEDITVDSGADFAYAGVGHINVSPDAPDAVCVDLTGKVISRGAGSFSCPQGVYIVNDMHGRSVKLVVR